MNVRTLLELGRVSNLPTVWSNVLAGAALGGGTIRPFPLFLVGCAGTLFYVGGMFLNDAFDAEVDARQRPERPIPSGRATRVQVFAAGFGMLAVGLALLFATASAGLVAAPFELGLAGVATALCVVIYDRWHKGYAWSPLVMGACRGGLYILGALSSAAQLGTAVLAGAGAIALYVLGLTHIARFETASNIGRVWPVALVFGPAALAIGLAGPPRTAIGALAGLVLWLGLVGWALFSIRLALRGGRQIGRAVVALIAGIALADAALMAAMGAFGAASFGVLAFGLTLLGQRAVRGT